MIEKKMGSTLKIFLFIILIICSCFGGWFFGEWLSKIRYPENVVSKEDDEKDSKNEENNNKEDATAIQLNVNDEAVINLFNGLDTYGSTYGDNNCAVLNYDYFRESKVTTSNLNKNTPVYAALNYLNKLGVTFNGGETFTREQIHEAIGKIFGSSYVYVDDNIDMCPSIAYDNTTGVYTVGVPGCGGTCAPSNQKKLVSASMIGDTIELGVRVLFVGVNSSNNVIYYSDVKKTRPVEVSYAQTGEIDLASFDKGSLYKISFKKENENYVFVSSELAK